MFSAFGTIVARSFIPAIIADWHRIKLAGNNELVKHNYSCSPERE
jgi:hypothetical protein